MLNANAQTEKEKEQARRHRGGHFGAVPPKSLLVPQSVSTVLFLDEKHD